MIAALTPSITEAVRAALAGGQSQTSVTITQQAQVDNLCKMSNAEIIREIPIFTQQT